ncbi:MAG: asparagine synthase (glutamine-hydrolyzing) [Acidobacteriota bacterium]
MCGISGLVTGNNNGAKARLDSMTASLAHRGPDDAGSISSDGVYLGHRRLTVVDLSANGHQPMSNEDGSVWISYNGELYDTDALRTWLEARGHRFRSRTDTEVLVHLYEEEGVNLFRRINGMFAFAIHDRRKKKLLLARDRLGIKPLFYTIDDGEFLFASELKAIFSGLGSKPSLRQDVLGQYMLQGFASAPDTLFEGVHALPPGHWIELDLARLSDGRKPEPVEYWDAPFTGDDTRAVEELEAELEMLLADAVRIRMIADVPLGAFLSGGIDSSTIVALMARASDDRVRSFTVDVPNTDRSERDKALAVAEMYQCAHVEIESSEVGAEEYWARLAHFDTPFNCPSLLNAWLVSRAARQYVTVAISGDGADELFGGYARYQEIGGRRQIPFAKNLVRAARTLIPHDLRGRSRMVDLSNDSFMNSFTARHPFPVEAAEKLVGVSLRDWVHRMRAIYERYLSDPITRALYLDVKTYLADHILAKVDSASMAVSLEVRVPFLDYRIVEFAGRLPASVKIRDGNGKWLLKRIARRLLPEGLVEQQKVGFDPPLASWLFSAQMESSLAELSRPDACFRDVLDGRLVDHWIKELRLASGWRVPQRSALWAVYQLEHWMQVGSQADRPAVAAAR